MRHPYFKSFSQRYEDELHSNVQEEQVRLGPLLEYIREQEPQVAHISSAPSSYPLTRHNSIPEPPPPTDQLSDDSEQVQDVMPKQSIKSPRTLYPISEDPAGLGAASRQARSQSQTGFNNTSSSLGARNPPPAQPPKPIGVKRTSLASIPIDDPSSLGGSTAASLSVLPVMAQSKKSAQTSSGFFLSNTKLSSYLTSHKQHSSGYLSRVTFTQNSPSPDLQTASSTIRMQKPPKQFEFDAFSNRTKVYSQNGQRRSPPHQHLRQVPSTLSQGSLQRQLSELSQQKNNNNIKPDERRADAEKRIYHRKANLSKPEASSVLHATGVSSYRGTILKSVTQSPITHNSKSPQALETAISIHNVRDQLEPSKPTISPFLMQTETDGFRRLQKVSSIGYAQRHMNRKPSDKLPSLPSINRYPSRPRISEYSPKVTPENYGRRFLDKQRGSGQGNSVRISETTQHQQTRRMEPLRSYGGGGGGMERLKPKTPSDLYGSARGGVVYPSNMTPQLRTEKKLTARPLRNPPPSYSRVGRL